MYGFYWADIKFIFIYLFVSRSNSLFLSSYDHHYCGGGGGHSKPRCVWKNKQKICKHTRTRYAMDNDALFAHVDRANATHIHFSVWNAEKVFINIGKIGQQFDSTNHRTNERANDMERKETNFQNQRSESNWNNEIWMNLAGNSVYTLTHRKRINVKKWIFLLFSKINYHNSYLELHTCKSYSAAAAAASSNMAMVRIFFFLIGIKCLQRAGGICKATAKGGRGGDGDGGQEETKL